LLAGSDGIIYNPSMPSKTRYRRALVIPGALSIITKAYADPTERAHVIGSWAQTVRFSDMGELIGRLEP
jgi:hypothetical protein